MEDRKLFSVVIVNFNYGRYLGDAIESVLKQSCQEFELIVVDGGSTDNSVEVIKRYAERIAWWCSEPDEGQSDAFNKGFGHSRGRFLTWLNADDVFFPGALARAKRAIQENPECEWFAGGCFWLDPELRVIKCSGARPFSRVRANRGEISVWAPSSFFSKSLLDRVGGIDVKFHYMMDTELWLRFYRLAGMTYCPVSGYGWGLRLHPAAKMSGHNFACSEHSKASHPKWESMRLEWKIFVGRYGAPRVSRLLWWLTTPPSVFLHNRFDSWRYKGKYYQDCLPPS